MCRCTGARNRPPEIADEIGTADRRIYYRPSPHGDEAEIGPRLRVLWGNAPYDTEEWWELVPRPPSAEPDSG